MKKLEEMREEFARLSDLPMPDPKNPTPIYVSRMHFAEWGNNLSRAIRELAIADSVRQQLNTKLGNPPNSSWEPIYEAVRDHAKTLPWVNSKED